MSALPEALAAWSDVVGPEHVSADASLCAAYAAATYDTATAVAAVVRPATRDEVAACLRVAARFRVPVSPLSCGKNWGLGSRAPARDGAVVLDLGRMRTITAFDEEMAWVEVEPGVTFRQLHAFLAERGSRLFASVTGSSPDASVLGNALDRGDGGGPLGDRPAHVCALEAVLSTGEVVRTGFARHGESSLAHVHRWGLGPSLEGLLAQSNVAVVTRMTVWLAPLPRSVQAFRFTLHDDARLPGLVDALRGLRLDGTLRAPVGLWNRLRVLSTQRPRPTVTAEAPRWFGLAGLYAATELQGRALREHVAATLASHVDGWHAEERVGDPVAGRELLWETEPAFGWLQGVPHEESLRSAYWAKPSAPERDLDPDRDRCGVVWACAALPLRGRDVARLAMVVESVMPAHGFDPMLAIVAPTERCAYAVPSILYDRDEGGADARAKRCHDALLDAFAREQWLPHRLGVGAMERMAGWTDDSAAVLRRVRAALDPAAVVAPGRYDAYVTSGDGGGGPGASSPPSSGPPAG